MKAGVRAFIHSDEFVPYRTAFSICELPNDDLRQIDEAIGQGSDAGHKFALLIYHCGGEVRRFLANKTTLGLSYAVVVVVVVVGSF